MSKKFDHLIDPGPAVKTPPLSDKGVSRKDFSALGLEDMAYIKTVEVEGQLLHAIHAADGTPLTVMNGRAVAFAAVRQHDMEPMSVH